MQLAAQQRKWSDDDFNNVLGETLQLPGRAFLIWRGALSNEEEAIRAWACGLASAEFSNVVAAQRQVKRNPNWSRDELILALDLYVKHRPTIPAKESIEISELSNVLTRLGEMLGQAVEMTYRNENGVYMKLMNFRRFDNKYTTAGKTGLQRGNQDDGRVWNQFAEDPVRLAEVARFIRQSILEHGFDKELAGSDEPGIEEAEEGKVATRVHRYRERDRRLVTEAKTRAMREHGRLVCAACGFDFSKRYGEVGADLIDVHHTKPVHSLQPGEKTKVADLCLLCSNCHRVVHSRRRWLTIEQLKASLEHS